MAEIEITYLKGYCDLELPFYDKVCHSEYACEVQQCSNFYDGNNDPYTIPYGNCIHAKYNHCYKGCTTKSYEINTDYYDSESDSIPVVINRKTYDCVKVKLNGKCIFGEQYNEV